jgi:hypothetical protein
MVILCSNRGGRIRINRSLALQEDRFKSYRLSVQLLISSFRSTRFKGIGENKNGLIAA